MMQVVGADLRVFMEEHGLSQSKLARQARVSQATVSRVLKGGARQRVGRGYSRIFSYIQKVRRRGEPSHANKDEVLKAFERIWTASQAHAGAVAKVIDALDG